jgi:hypothetical protein
MPAATLGSSFTALGGCSSFCLQAHHHALGLNKSDNQQRGDCWWNARLAWWNALVAHWLACAGSGFRL